MRSASATTDLASILAELVSFDTNQFELLKGISDEFPSDSVDSVGLTDCSSAIPKHLSAEHVPHLTPSQSFYGSESASEEAVDGKSGKSQVFKSRLCVFYAAGRCSHGESCSFAHSPFELADGKTIMCPQVEAFGFCDSVDCPLAHTPSELKPLPRVAKTAWCRYYPLGKCRAGSACRHAHSAEEMEPEEADQSEYSPFPPSYAPSFPAPKTDDNLSSFKQELARIQHVIDDEEPLDIAALQHSLLFLAMELEKVKLGRRNE